MAMDGHPKELPKSQKPSDERTLALMFDMLRSFQSELLGALKDLKAQAEPQNPRDRKTETISVLRSALTVHDEIAAQRKVCQEESRQAFELQLDLFHANHIKPLLTSIDTIRRDIETMCSDAETTTKSIRNGNAETNSSIGTVQQTIQGLCSTVFGRRNAKGEVETDGLDASVRDLITWKIAQEDRRRQAEAAKSDFRYYLGIFLKFIYWLGPFVLSAISVYVALKATGPK
jgi:hypothetical protein